MSEAALTCPKCRGEMVQGFIRDWTYGRILIETWHRGAPKKSFWTGVKLPEPKNQVPVGTFRCQSCGFLESYARADFAPK